MLSRPRRPRPSLSVRTTTTSYLFLWSCLAFIVPLVCAQNHHSDPSVYAVVHNTDTHAKTGNDTVVCRPFGRCEPCPGDSLNEPFCQPFGNRRLMHCVNTSHPSSQPLQTSPPAPPKGETPAWQSCGRIPEQERADFYEFVACNVVFAAVALGLVVVRSRRMEMVQARRVAARIGLVRGGG